MNFFKKFDLPTFIAAGESGSAKSSTLSKLPSIPFQKGMGTLAGPGMTTPCPSITIFTPYEEFAQIELLVKTYDEIVTDLIRNLRPLLTKECKNALASLPTDNPQAKQLFIQKAVETRYKLDDETFKIHKLFNSQQLSSEYSDFLNNLINCLLNTITEASRANYSETAKESKQDAFYIVDMLVSQTLETCAELVNELAKSIQCQIDTCLNNVGFNNYKANNLSAQDFDTCCRAITNSSSKEFDTIQSAACGLKQMTITVPGKGLPLKNTPNSPYCIIDVVGFNNDGLSNINKRIKQVTLTPYSYDGIIYFASTRAVNKTHESYINSILNTIRPAKLIIASTFMDLDDIFQSDDDYPTEADILAAHVRRKKDLLNMVQSIITNDIHVLPPTLDDIICISNKTSKKKHGLDACAIYNDSQYDTLRMALAHAFDTIRSKIHINGVTNTTPCLATATPIALLVGQIINQLGTAIDTEYTVLRNSSSRIHHWTLDAILWNLLYGYQHHSNALVWENVQICTFTNMTQICLDNLSNLRFTPNLKLTSQKDFDMIKKEFISNLESELYYAVRNFVLQDANNPTIDSRCKMSIASLSKQPKYNKWKIVDDLRLNLMNAVTQSSYLESLLNNAFINAWHRTYNRIFF